MNEFDKLFYSIVGKKLRTLRIEKDYTLKDVASHVDLTEKTIQRYETGERKIKEDKLKEIVDFLGGDYDSFIKEVQTEQLGSQKSDSLPDLNAKDERDIAKDLSFTLEQLETAQTGIMFDGEPLDDETRELLKISLENSIRLGKQIAKQKYTNKRYKKD
nr:MAG TPA: helix-turn-helix domain protein [Caudoviricetes sp.]